jgi:hypothetical protein
LISRYYFVILISRLYVNQKLIPTFKPQIQRASLT